MAPVNADVAEVEAQLCAVRRRRNGLAAQRALAGISSAILIAAAFMIAAALRGSAGLFAFATTLAAAGTLACAGSVVWLTRRDWLSLPATAHLADAQAALDNRLTTLLAVAPLSPPPPLRPLLVDQAIQARPHWSVEALAPRRFSPWLALVPLAFAVLAAATFYARPPAAAAPRRAAPQKTLVGSATAPASDTAQPHETQGHLGSATRPAAPAPAVAGLNAADGSSAPREGVANAAGGSSPLAGTVANDAPADSALDRLRQSIQDAFGGPPSAGGQPRDTRGDAINRGNREAGDDMRPDGPSTTGGRADASQHPPGSSPPGQRAGTTDRAAPAAQASHGTGRGGAAQGGTKGVLGASDAPREVGNSAAPVAIRLNALTGMSPSQTDPQRSHDVPAAATNASRANRPSPALADDQLADATVRPLDVGPEHEAIIRRIFTRE